MSYLTSLFFKHSTTKQKWLHGLASLLIIALSLSFFWYAKNLDWQYLVTLKYIGFVIVCFFGSAIIFLPFPLSIFIGASALFLNPIIVGLLGGLVVSIGSMIPYFVGFEGKIIFQDIRGYKKVHDWATKNLHGFWSILFISLLPLPLFDIVCVSAGILGIKFRRYFLAVLIGKTTSYLFFAFMSYYIGLNFPQIWELIRPYLVK